MKKKIFFFFPAFLNNSGHENSFVNPLIKISKRNKILYSFLTPHQNNIKNKNYNLFYKSTNILSKIRNIFFNLFILNKILNNDNSYKNILYIDGFSLYDLVSILFSSFKINFKLIIYIRHKYKNIFKQIIFIILINMIKKKCNNFIILTDTLILKKYLKNKFFCKTLLLPIPHIINKKQNTNKIKKNKIKVWCPGPIRKEKYGENFNLFIRNNLDNKFILSVNKNYKNFTKLKNIKLLKLQPNLNRIQYENEFFKNDLIILPYENSQYEEKTSGIFVESISLAKLVLVSDKTWMSDELKKNNLREFIVKDWNKCDLKSFVENLDVVKINKKLKKMRKKYIKFHNEKNFINILSYAIK